MRDFNSGGYDTTAIYCRFPGFWSEKKSKSLYLS